MVCILPHQAGSWTKKRQKKDNPIHFRWTPPLIFHYKRTKKWCITKPSTHLHGMKAKWKPILNIHQSLKWILCIYRVLVTYACLTGCLCMWETPHSLRTTCHTDTPPTTVLSLTRGLQKTITPHGRGTESNKSRDREGERWYTYAGCRLWHSSPCHWELPCWRPYRWSADLSRCWKAIDRACSQCSLSSRPSARSAKSIEGPNEAELRNAGSCVDVLLL